MTIPRLRIKCYFLCGVVESLRSRRCTVVCNTLISAKPVVVCLQESKLYDLHKLKARSFLPSNLSEIACLNARGTRGGIVTAWDTSLFSLVSTIVRQYSLTTTLSTPTPAKNITITNTYAPTDHRDSMAFHAELLEILSLISGPWLLLGDFSLTAVPVKRTQTPATPVSALPLTTPSISSPWSSSLSSDASIYTCSSKQASTILARLDHAFINLELLSTYPTTSLSPLVRQNARPLLLGGQDQTAS